MPRTNHRPLVFLSLILAGLTAILLTSQWRAAHAHDLVPWRSDLAAAEAEAKSQHKRVFAYFTATWCAPCQQMKRTTWADNKVLQAIEAKYVPVKIDVDAQQPLALSYAIESMPTYILLSDSGAPMDRRSGLLDETEMLNWLSPASLR